MTGPERGWVWLEPELRLFRVTPDSRPEETVLGVFPEITLSPERYRWWQRQLELCNEREMNDNGC